MTATTEISDSPAIEADTTAAAPKGGAAGPRRGRALVLRGVLLVVAAALVTTGVVLLIKGNDTKNQRATTDRALVDSKPTATVIGQVSTALNQVLSYDYRKPQTAQAAAKHWLTGDAPGQYATLFSQLQKLAPGQQLTLVAKVSTAGVTYLRGDRARLLVFLDQESTRASDGQSSVSAAQVQIGAVRHGDTWQIDELKPL